MLYGLAGDPFYNLWIFAQLAGAGLQVSWGFPNSDPSHILLPAQPLIDLQGFILARLFNPVAAYNIYIALSFPLTFIASYLLAKKLIKNNLAAIFSAFVITFLPYRLAHSQVHLNLISTQWLLFFIYFLISLWERPNLKNSLVLGLFGALVMLDNYQYFFFATVIAASFLICALIISLYQKKFNHFLKFFSFGLMALAFLAVLVFIFDPKIFVSLITGSNLTNLGPKRELAELSVYSAHWRYFLLPSPFLRFGAGPFQGGFEKLQELGTNLAEQTLFLGWLPLALALFALFEARRNRQTAPIAAFLALLTGVAFVFSFAPEISFWGAKIKTPAYFIFQKFPVIRVFARFGWLSGISIGILAGYGFKYLASRLKISTLWLLIGFLFLLGMEFWPKNLFPSQNINQVSPIYQKLAELPPGPLAEYPFLPAEEPESYDYLAAQLYHHRPLLYGSGQNTEGDKFRQEVLDPSSAQSIKTLQEIRVKYIIVHGDKYTSKLTRKYPNELNEGKIPKVNDARANLISCVQEKCLYEIK